MDWPTYALYFVGILAVVKVIQLGALWTALMATKYRQEQTALTNADRIPETLKPIFDAAHQQLSGLGFQYAHTHVTETAYVHRPSLFVQAYIDPQTRTYAHVNPAGLPEAGIPFDVEFITHFDNGDLLSSINGVAHRQEPLPASYHQHDAYAGNLQGQWTAHKAILETKMLQGYRPVLLDAEQSIESLNQHHRSIADYRVTTGFYRPTRQPQVWRPHLWSALKIAWRIQAGDKKRLAAIKACGVEEQVSPASVTAELNAYLNIQEEQLGQKWGWLPKSLLFLISAVACALSFGLVFSWQTIPILLAVLLLHEGGHITAMWACGYRDRQVLFLPFLGAAAIGQKEGSSIGQKLFVYLMGPVPGLLLGMGCLYLIDFVAWYNIDLWYEIGLLAIILNYLNLLPISPLDGGRVVETLFLTRFPRLQGYFLLFSAIVFAFAAWSTTDMLLFTITVFLLLSLPTQWRYQTLLLQVAKTLPGQVGDKTRLQIIVQHISGSKVQQQQIKYRFQMIRRLMQHFAEPQASLRVILAGGVIYLLALLLPVASIVAYATFSSPNESRVETLRIMVQATLGKSLWPDPNWEKRLSRVNAAEEQWEILMQAGRWEIRQGSIKQANGYFRRALDIARVFEQRDLRTVDTIEQLANLALVKQDGQALAYYQEAIDTIESGFGPQHLRIADLLQRMVWRYDGDYPVAKKIALLERAQHIRQHHGLGNDATDGYLLSDLAELYEADGQLQEAEKSLRNALSIFDRLDARPSDEPTTRRIAMGSQVVRELASLYVKEGQPQRAEQLLGERIIRWHDEAFVAAELASQLGWLYLYRPDLPAAYKRFEDALLLIRSQWSDDRLGVELMPFVLDLCYLDLLQNQLASARARFTRLRQAPDFEDYLAEYMGDSFGEGKNGQTGEVSLPRPSDVLNWQGERMDIHEEIIRRLM